MDVYQSPSLRAGGDSVGASSEQEDYCGEVVAKLGHDLPCVLEEDECDFELVIPDEVR